MDTNFRKWHWTQWLIILFSIFYFHEIFSNVFLVIKGLNLRITLMIFIGILLNIYNFLNVFGLSVNKDFKSMAIPTLIPPGLLIIEMLLFFFLRKLEILLVGWKSMFLIFLISLLYSGLFLLFHKTNEIITIPIVEGENSSDFK